MDNRPQTGPQTGLTTATTPDDEVAGTIAAALDWWRLAGVDHIYHDQPAQWISPARPTAIAAQALREEQYQAPLAPEPAAPPPPSSDEWPQDLAGFAPWWLREPWLDAGRTAERVPPRGMRAPQVMVLVEEPESDDRERLLTGPQGRLLDAALAAMGVDPGDAYVASALPRHTPLADWAETRERGLGRVLAHHVALVAPKRLICLGFNILPLLGHDPTNMPAVVTTFHDQRCSIPLLGSRSLTSLIERPGWKAELWRAWLGWTMQDPQAQAEGAMRD